MLLEELEPNGLFHALRSPTNTVYSAIVSNKSSNVLNKLSPFNDNNKSINRFVQRQSDRQTCIAAVIVNIHYFKMYFRFKTQRSFGNVITLPTF